MGNTQTDIDTDEKYDKITSRQNDCEKFNACDKDKLYKELTKQNNSPRRKSKSFRKTKTKKIKRTKTKTKSKMSY